MRQLLSAILHFLLRHALQFVLFVAILLAGRWFVQEWRAYSAASASLAVLQQAASSADAHGLKLADAATRRTRALQQASQAAIAQRIGAVETRLQQLRSARQPSLFSWPLPDSAQLARHAGQEAARSVEIEVLQQESRYLQTLLSALQGEDARAALARLHQMHIEAYAALQANLRQQRQLKAEHPLAAYLAGQAAHARMTILEQQEAQLRAANLQAYQQYQLQRARTTAATHPAPFAPDQPALKTALAPLQAAIVQGSAQQDGNWIARLRGPVREVAPTAALLVLSAILLPIAIKAFYFFVIAPLAGRFKPLQIAPGFQQAGQHFALPPNGLSRISAVSQQLQLDPGQEMLIHPDYLQSSPVGTHKRTQWLLDWRYPFTSLAAGMTALTKLHGSERAAITISASTDPLQEVAVLHLPPGSAIVFQPRGLVGLIQQQGQPVAMSSHWRLTSLHAWLTLQLRFIVFRGPTTLLVHGCRGVRMERADTGRAISQAATLGFSTDVLYATTRSETFVPYLRGQQALFNDRFDGDGIFLYEETPRQGKQPGRAGRWFEGAADAVLKVFGI